MSTATNTRFDFLTLRSVERVPNILSDVSEAVQSQYAHSPQVKKFADMIHDEISGEPFAEFLSKNYFIVSTATGVGLDSIADRVGVSRVASFTDGTSYKLTDPELRNLIAFKARANIGEATLKSIQDGLDILFDGVIKVIDNGDMTLTLIVESPLTRVQLWLLKNYGLSQRGGGVGYKIQGTYDVIFGFRYSGLYPFNIGVFNYPLEELSNGN